VRYRISHHGRKCNALSTNQKEEGCAYEERRTVMTLELTEKEKYMLTEVLKDYIPELRGEIASGAKHDFKMELKEEEAVLKNILEKLKN